MKQPSHFAVSSNPKPVSGLLPVLILGVMLTLFVSTSFAEPAASADYSLTASVTGQGRISPSGPLTVREGGRMSFVFNADAGHSIADVIVDGASLGPIHAFSFENIDAPHTIQAVFETDSIAVSATSDGNNPATCKGKANRDL